MTVGQVLAKISAGEAGAPSGDAKTGDAEAQAEALDRESPQSAGKVPYHHCKSPNEASLILARRNL